MIGLLAGVWGYCPTCERWRYSDEWQRSESPACPECGSRGSLPPDRGSVTKSQALQPGRIPSVPLMLTLADREILDFERGWFLHPEPKDRTIGEVLGLSPAEYYDRLRNLMSLPEAAAYDPLTVRRLRRMVGAA